MTPVLLYFTEDTLPHFHLFILELDLFIYLLYPFISSVNWLYLSSFTLLIIGWEKMQHWTQSNIQNLSIWPNSTAMYSSERNVLFSSGLPAHRLTKSGKVLADEPSLLPPAWVPIDFFSLFFLPLNHVFWKHCYYPPVHSALMNAFQPSLPCFLASHYQSAELISLLTAGAIMRLLSLISNSYRIPAVFPTKSSLLRGFWY